MNYLRCFFVIGLTLLGISESYGQERKGALRQFRCLAWNKELSKKIKGCYFNGGLEIQIDNLSFLQFSSMYKWRGEGALYMGMKGKPVSEETPKDEIIKIPFKPGQKKCIVIFVPNEDEPSGVGALVFNDELKDFPWGSYKFLNGSGMKLLFKLQNKEVSLSKRPVPKVVDLGLPKQNIEVAMAMDNEEKKLLLKTVWLHRPNVRSWVLLMPSERKDLGIVYARVIEDLKPLPPTKPNE